MLAPGSKGWIKKYFDLVEKKEIRLRGDLPAKIDQDEFIHAALGRTGVIFGYPTRLLFAKEIDDSKWTTDEKLKVLLFESHLFLYKVHHEDEHQINREDFISALIGFYGHHNGSTVTKVFNFFRKDSEEEMIEDILTKRVDIKVNYLENTFWVNYLNNVFIYLDIILFNSYLKHRKKSTFFNYDELAMNALTAITLSAFSDGQVEKQEKVMFSVFLASANLSDLQREIAEERFVKGADFSDFSDCLKDNWIYRRFLLDLSTFVIYSNHDASDEERTYLNKFSNFLEFTDLELNEALALTEQFIINNQDKIPFLENKSSIEKVYGSLSKRWIKILGRNKDKLVTEINQSKELVQLIRKSTKTELTKEEKEAVKTQFLDIVKSMPSLAIFMLPGGTVLLPIILKIIPDLMPSAFKDNEVEK
jgi:hypothetical protein